MARSSRWLVLYPHSIVLYAGTPAFIRPLTDPRSPRVPAPAPPIEWARTRPTKRRLTRRRRLTQRPSGQRTPARPRLPAGTRGGADKRALMSYALLYQARVLTIDGCVSNVILKLGDPSLISKFLTRLEIAVIGLLGDVIDFSSCPALEILVITHCDLCYSRIVSPSVKYLRIADSEFFYGTRTRISVPSVIYLHLDRCNKKASLLDAMPYHYKLHLSGWAAGGVTTVWEVTLLRFTLLRFVVFVRIVVLRMTTKVVVYNLGACQVLQIWSWLPTMERYVRLVPTWFLFISNCWVLPFHSWEVVYLLKLFIVLVDYRPFLFDISILLTPFINYGHH